MIGMKDHDIDPATHLVHHDYQPPTGFVAPQPGVFKASTVIFPNVAAMRSREWKDKSGYTYGLHGTPTTFILEERLCALEGGLQCVLVPSGLAAIANVGMALLKSGDEVLIPDNAYGPGKDFANGELARFGITHAFYDPLDPADLAARITSATRLVWLEAPGSVSMEFPDLCEQVRICRARGVTTALDNTWGAGLAFAPFDLTGDGSLGVDISAHALTKYPSGGGDVLMGSVITRDLGLHMKIKLTHMRLGLGVGANDAEAILRALPSIGLRYRAHDEAARQLARWLQQQPALAHNCHGDALFATREVEARERLVDYRLEAAGNPSHNRRNATAGEESHGDGRVDAVFLLGAARNRGGIAVKQADYAGGGGWVVSAPARSIAG